MKDVARVIRTHFEGIAAWARTRMINGFLEALNGLFQAAKCKARGYRRLATLRAIIFLNHTKFTRPLKIMFKQILDRINLMFNTQLIGKLRHLSSIMRNPIQVTVAPRISGNVRFSVVIPTRDRPGLLTNAIRSVLNQTYENFQLIVSDNPVHQDSKQMVESFNDPRIEYVRAPGEINMHDHWEFAVSHAKGDYVIVLIDKNLLKATALEQIYRLSQKYPSEIYSWAMDTHVLDRESKGDFISGNFTPCYYLRNSSGKASYVNCKNEMNRRLSFKERIGYEGVAYFYAKICFGAYSRRLIRKIIKEHGKLFPPYSPDYTSMSLALASTRGFVDVGKSLGIQLLTSVSNGMRAAADADYAENWIRNIDTSPNPAEQWPISNFMIGAHNAIAYDYRVMPNYSEIDSANLFIQVVSDFCIITKWRDEKQKKDYQSLLLNSFNELSPADQIKVLCNQKTIFDKFTIEQYKINSNNIRISNLESTINALETERGKTISENPPSGLHLVKEIDQTHYKTLDALLLAER